MKTKSIVCGDLKGFQEHLLKEEKSVSTIKKYVHDVEVFLDFLGERPISKEMLIEYKNSIVSSYTVSSINTILASINSYLCFIGLSDLKFRYEKLQHKAFRDDSLDLTREEYFRLVDAAISKHKIKLALILETIASTGMRVSELGFVTVDSVRRGRVDIRLKGKNREVLLPDRLCTTFEKYIEVNNIKEGSIFVTRKNKLINRSNIYISLKRLCKYAGVNEKKVYPHNFRHFFALAYYRETGDLIHLSDILGHSSVDTTRIYTSCPLDTFKKQINSLNLVR